MNSVNLFGKIINTPERRQFPSGSQVVELDLSVKTYNGYDIFKCKAWAKTADIAATYCRKGDMVAVNGCLKNEQYESKGTTVKTNTVQVQSISFGSKAKDESDDYANEDPDFA